MNDREKRKRFISESDASRIMLAIVGISLLTLLFYTFFVAVRGIEVERFYFNVVELLPLFLMVAIYWISYILRPKRPNR
ncbi:MAG TPA: hypothetical protein PKD64_13125 [Pirellulaceae bacterium]|nr:hypothetical protein [Pirellulaceae bacterium]HMO93128.1 hypothetical protein [Pirellulaceae bacterium]HMP70313.1 hypothetical protein [Pirellulaceae bacterium]